MDWLIVVLIGIVGVVVLIWAMRVGRPRGSQLSDADHYMRELTSRSHSSRISAPQNMTSAQSTQAYTQAPAVQLPPQLVAQAQGMVRNGQKIQAIALIRQVTGFDLATSKRIADNL
ncbi:hypothetical protein RSal33209_3522 [Renibacterium salmoninarum ATCC 33209]|uniref:Ribosomal protein L7/L12 C-terminal domain-containing protein n=1 Tax=Renibacterium salmoninarum (strain ATCC 33209 / DSM 20767 / JCM 11484 / NBRC 15589 / NCIMB 2235) TaxID=288705 RepID=A9WVL0_RENSM|nr:hypothetical protein [Renibacterium salmoninarum]ABY25231.1 hypothetical protein RSal33209_3522 [Renibacterium salmoninarum ATCC 33209]